jgi:hypothetical protein
LDRAAPFGSGLLTGCPMLAQEGWLFRVFGIFGLRPLKFLLYGFEQHFCVCVFLNTGKLFSDRLV